MSSLCVVSMTFLTFLAMKQGAACHVGWKRYEEGNLCFQFHSERRSWEDAKDACIGNCAHLAEPINPSIDKFLREEVWRINRRRWQENPLEVDQAGYWWIGGSDRKTEGEFVWETSGLPFGYTNWFNIQPNKISANPEDCVQYWIAGGWDDNECQRERPFICQKEDEP